MKNKQHGFAEFFVIGLILFVLFGGAVFMDRLSCKAKWENSGMRSSWGLLKGCQVEVSAGRWLPEERIREIDLSPKKADK